MHDVLMRHTPTEAILSCSQLLFDGFSTVWAHSHRMMSEPELSARLLGETLAISHLALAHRDLRSRTEPSGEAVGCTHLLGSAFGLILAARRHIKVDMQVPQASVKGEEEGVDVAGPRT